MMASVLAGDDNTLTTDDNTEIICVNLALAVKREDADQFVKIYDTVPADFNSEKVDDIKARARKLSEKSVSFLECYRADLQKNGLTDPSNADEETDSAPTDINNNPRPGFCLPEDMAYVNLNGMVNGKDHAETRSRKLLPNGPVTGPLSVRNTNDIANAKFNNPGAIWGQKSPTREVDDKIQFGPLNKNFGISNSVPEQQSSRTLQVKTVKSSAFNSGSSNTDKCENDKGPCPPIRALEASVALIGKPSENDIKNCPAPEPIPADTVGSVNETTPFLSHPPGREGSRRGVPQKRQGEQQKERELEDVYCSPTSFDEEVQAFPPNYGTCEPQETAGQSAATAPAEVTTSEEKEPKKKKKKKKKKAKQVDAGIATTETAEAMKSIDDLSQPSSPSYENDAEKKTATEPHPQRSDSVKSERVAREKTVKQVEKNNALKLTKETPGKKKTDSKKKKVQSDNSVKKVAPPKKKAGPPTRETVAADREDKSESEGVSESDDGSFGQWQRRTLGVAGSFDEKALESEADNRTAMSDPGENEDNHGWNPVVKHRKPKRREKFAGHSGLQYSPRNFSMDDSSSLSPYYRGRNPAWDYLRKSSSLPKEMCKYGRKRIVMSDPDDMTSTATTTTTTPSRRNSLEMSDENISEQKKHSSSSSYAGRLKATMPGAGYVQSTRELVKDSSEEVLTANHGSDKTSNSMLDSKNLNESKDKWTSNFQPAEKAKEGDVASSHSLSEAMHPETGTSQKFEANFPNLTSSEAPVGGNETNPSHPLDKSVQYLDREFAKNSYAGRVKHSGKESNNTATDSVPTGGNGPRTGVNNVGGGVTQKSIQALSADSFNVHKEKQSYDIKSVQQPANLESKAKTDVSPKLSILKFTSDKKDIDDNNVTLTPSYETSSVGPLNNTTKTDRERQTRQQMPSEIITFGSLLINQEDEICILNDDDSCGLSTGYQSGDGNSESGLAAASDERPSDDNRMDSVSMQSSDGVRTSENKKPKIINKSMYVSELEGNLPSMKPGSDPAAFNSNTDPRAADNVPVSGVGSLRVGGLDWIQVLAGVTERPLMCRPGGSGDDGKTLTVQLMSSKKVTVDVSGGWENASRFNHASISEMFARDWERTMEQSQSDPSSVVFA